ncbi:hypothetical protein bcgnr5378_37730 [Bacillus cereus]|uniref:Uncharacterized protein n=1 Tax=Bacillus cereus TaxID=1396 RepID=A0A164QMB6_BACCE|nr:hypothetical protein [Bacillus cereus]KZD71897.1 hypothetical protein B4088_0358 [Bacillus cereus]
MEKDSKELTYADFVKKELDRWVQLNSEGKELPGIVNRLLETAYKKHTGNTRETASLRKVIIECRVKREIEMVEELEATEKLIKKINEL